MENLENEIWVDTYLSPRYEVSNLGRVRTKDRYHPYGESGELRLFKSKILQGYYTRGYQYFKILPKIGQRINVGAHQLVYHSFHNSEPMKGMVVDHIDGNRLNNCLNNLQFITNAENIGRGKTHSERKTKLPLYIYKAYKGFVVRRNIDGKRIIFAKVETLGDAIAKKKELIKLNWPEPIKDETTKYISWVKRLNRYKIEKFFSGTLKWFGSFKTLEEAVKRRDELIASNWENEN